MQKMSEYRKRCTSQFTQLTVPDDSLYVNTSRLLLKSKSPSDKMSYFNINAYIDIKNAPITLSEIEDDNDYDCEEIGDPGKNYHFLDCRKNRLKKPNVFIKTSISINRFIERNQNPWRRRSASENIDNYSSKVHNLTYADLVITNELIPPNGDECEPSPKRHINLEQFNYLEIDFIKTQALEDIGHELEKIKRSKLSNTSYRWKMQSIVNICQRLMGSVKNVRKPVKKNQDHRNMTSNS